MVPIMSTKEGIYLFSLKLYKGIFVFLSLFIFILSSTACQTDGEMIIEENYYQPGDVDNQERTVKLNGKEIQELSIYKYEDREELFFTFNHENIDSLSTVVQLLSYGVKVNGETEVDDPNYRIKLKYKSGEEDIAYLWLSKSQRRSSFYIEGDEKQIYLLSEMMTDKLKRIFLK